MIVVPKKKLAIARVLVWSGLVLMIGGLIASTWLGKLSLIIIILGGIVFSVGAYMKQDMFRCPKCGEKLLAGLDFFSFNVLFERCPEFCPCCSTKIEVKKE